MTRHLVALLALVLPALATAGDGFRCEARGGPAWREVTSEHFQLLTDAPAAEAVALARDLEALQLAVRSALFRTPPPMPGHIPVIAFSRAAEFRTFAPGGTPAFEAPLDGRVAIVLSRASGGAARVPLAHALARGVLARVFLRQPRWFTAGLAAYLESLGAGASAVGRVPQHRLDAVTPWAGGLGPILRAAAPLESPREQGLAWALVHFLAQTRAQPFAALQGRLARGADPAAAWREAFPAWDPGDPAAMAALDAEVGAYLARGRFASRPLPIPTGEPEVEVRLLPSGRVHGLRLLLERRGVEAAARREGLRAEREEALAEDPAHVVALRALAAEAPEKAPAHAARAVSGHPDDPLAWRLAASAAAGTEPREKALRRAVELAPDHEGALDDLARLLVEAGRAPEALPHARRAAALAPAAPAVLDTYAEALARVGRCAEALPVQRRAVDLLTPADAPETGRVVRDRLARLEAACGRPPGGP